MNFWLLIRRSLRFYLRSHLGVVLGAAIGSAALIGALIVGDSVRGSLRDRALSRLGRVGYAMATGDRFFQQTLQQRVDTSEVHTLVRNGTSWVRMGEFGKGTANALQVAGTAARQDGTARANQVNVYGIDAAGWSQLVQTGAVRFTQFDAGTGTAELFAAAGIGHESQTAWMSGDALLLNSTLARQLQVKPGDEILLRIRKPSALAQDAVISPREGTSLAFRLKVAGILNPSMLGDFSLMANQTPPANAFLSLEFLAKNLELAGRANLFLSTELVKVPKGTWWDEQWLRFGGWLSRHGLSRSRASQSWYVSAGSRQLLESSGTQALSWLQDRLARTFSLEDAQLSVHAIEEPQSRTGGEYIQPSVEISSSRIFLESNVITAALSPRTRLLTSHFGFENDTTNDLAASQFVTNATRVLTYLANLIRDGDRATPYSMITAASGQFVPADMHDDEILINDWLADDLQAKPGDTLQISYYAVDSASRLVERTNSFKVRAFVPLKGQYADRTLMPDFPGIAKAERTQDWDTGFPLIYKIREKDEAYWKTYRGTPKAFITLAAGQAMWASRFGSLTAIRYEVPTNSFPTTYRSLAYKNLLANLDPAQLGFQFQPVREQALRAADQSQDFGQLFIGFSLFLVVAALLLMAILFQFSLEQRRTEIGTLLSLGFRPAQVRRLMLGEGAMLALLGAVLGAAAGLGYAKAMLWALTTVWRNAVGTSTLEFHVSSTSLFTGFVSSIVVAVITIWLTLRKQARQPARELLADEAPQPKSVTGRLARWSAAICTVLGLATIGYAISVGQITNPEIFFEAGSLLLIAGLAGSAAWLAAITRKPATADLTLTTLGTRACARRRKRSLATIALLASGCFVIVSIGVFRLDANLDARKRTSGTGGFTLIGQASLPVVQDLNSESGRQFFGLSDRDFNGVSIVPFRVRNGDEASCLNLNRAQRPRLMGVKPELLAGRFAFADTGKGLDPHAGWNLLKRSAASAQVSSPDEIPAIGDANSIQWALGKSVGDTLDYTDELGHTFKLRLVAAVANSILQGSLVIDEEEFVKRFPSESGYRFFLLDTPPGTTDSLSATLSRALQDQGMEIIPAVRRLDEFNAVQNTYLGTFQILGGLGLLLGSAGLGVVVLRNVLERRGELALLMAVGFRKRSISWLVLVEHGALLLVGLGLGVLAALVAVLPALLSPVRQLPYASLSVTLGAVLLNGLVWTWLATRLALRGNLLGALRNE